MGMGPPGDRHGAGEAKAVQVKVLLPSSFRKMRISDELAAQLGAATGRGGAPPAAGAVATARVASPLGKVWDVGVGRDGGGAFLGRGWPEYAAAHGLGVGWFVVLRHEGGGVLTAKVFDTTCCLKEFGDSTPVLTTINGRARGTSCKPQFLSILLPDFMDKMRIPDKFVQHYITEEHLNSNMAYISSPPGKFWRIGLEKDRSGVFFCGGWLQFLSFHGVSQGDVLLLRYRGNLVFKVEFFGPNGCRKDLKTDDTRVQQCEQTDAGIHQDEPFRRRKCIEKKRKIDEDNGNQHGTASSSGRKDSIKKRRTDGSERERRKKSQSIYEIGPPSWIKKKINEYILERCLVSLALTFCSSIGFAKKSTITLTMEMEMTSRGGGGGGNSSRRRSWEVAGRRYSHACYLLGDGWKRFCHDNGLKVGDVCVFTVVHTTLWHVGIERC